jgi:hypothetical protein
VRELNSILNSRKEKIVNKKVLLLIAMAAIFGVGLFFTVSAADHEFVGAAKCKMCHKIQNTSWLASKHAKAADVLKPEEQKNPKCTECHMTGKAAENPGVQCEACHGAGKDYMTMKVMKDPVAAKAAGCTVKVTKETCVKCHAAKSPSGNPNTNFKSFNYEEAVKKVHDHKPKA